MLIDIDKLDKEAASHYAFSELLDCLDMSFIFDDKDFSVRKRGDGLAVYVRHRNGEEELYDDRGELFVILSNLATHIFPNLDFRGEDYIFDYGEVVQMIKERAKC